MDIIRGKKINDALLYRLLLAVTAAVLALASGKELNDEYKENELLTSYTDYLQNASSTINETFTSVLVRHVGNGEVQDISRLNALSACLMDAGSGRVLYGREAYKEMPMASTTKIMTCMLILENANPDELVEISSYAASMPDVQLGLREGEKYAVSDLLYSLMLGSHNDTAVALAEHVSGSVDAFCIKMTAKAKELGALNTSFKTPNGLDADGHYTTARDLALITAYAIKNEDFIKITNTGAHSFHDVSGRRSFSVTNKNQFLHMMDGAIGVKTGFTGKAGYCFAGALSRKNVSLISTVLGSGWPPNKSYKWADTKKLMEYGLHNFKPVKLPTEFTLPDVSVCGGQSLSVKLTLDKPQTAAEESYHKDSVQDSPADEPLMDAGTHESFINELLLADWESYKISAELPRSVTAPIDEGTYLGRLIYCIDSKKLQSRSIYAAEDVKSMDFEFCIDSLFRLFIYSPIH